jgi:hypothetical protein
MQPLSATNPASISRLGGASTYQLTTFNRETRNKVLSIPRGQRVVIGEVSGCGHIAQFWLTFPGWFWPHWDPNAPISQTILKTLILRIYFDGAEHPAVAAPVGDFFGIGLCEVHSFASRYFGMSSGGFYCSFPMPFRKGFRIELENLDQAIDTCVFSNILYQKLDELPDDAGYFHARFVTGENPGPEPLELLNVQGAGRYVGCTLSMQGEHRGYLSFLEAPEQVSIDDDWDNPRIVGTGLEDYFLGGWYFREGPFIGPMHGVPHKDALNASIAMYRIHQADAIHFSRRLRFAFVNPWEPKRLKPFRYSGVGFLYLDRPEGAAQPIPPREQLLCWYRVRNTDHQSIP